MFGFLQAPAASCCGRTPDIWRSHFCGLATRMHQDFGSWSRFLVNRDSTFLALAGGLGEDNEGRLSTCCNPLAQPKMIIDSGRHVEYAADITLCALGIKLRDDAEDEGWARRLLSRVGSKTLEPAVDKAVVRLNSHNFPTEEIAETILAQNAIEATRPDALTAAQATATTYGRIFENCPSSQKEHWQKIGFSLGRLIYWDDAWRDWEKDQKRGRFNPLSNTSAPEMQEMMKHEFTNFQQNLTSLPPSPATDTLHQVANQTQGQLPEHNETPEQKKKRLREERKKNRKKKDGCCNRFDNCCNGNCDCCFDCGPGDTGCIDCCPCDC